MRPVLVVDLLRPSTHEETRMKYFVGILIGVAVGVGGCVAYNRLTKHVWSL